jgi:hypothetical protein
MEYPASGFHVTHGYMPEKGLWYHPGTGNVPLTFTSKKDIALSLIELIKLATSNPSSLPSHVRISGTNHTPLEICEIFNRKAGKKVLELQLLSEKEARAFVDQVTFIPSSGRMDEYDPEYMRDVASRVFLMTGGTGNLDFSMRNDNELVNPGERKWKWKSIEQYVDELGGLPREDFRGINTE